MPGSGALSIVNPPKSAKIAYPISTFTYVIAPTGAPQSALVKSFVQYALGPGHSFGANLDFAPLPKVVVKSDKSMAGRL